MNFIIDSILHLVEQNGVFGVFLGVFAESIFPPIPSEAILGYAGFLVGSGKQSFIAILIASVLGKLASSAPIWYLGKKYGDSFITNYGKYIGYTKKDYQKAEKVFDKYGYFAVFFSQFIPLVRSLISIPAGSLGIRFIPFMIFTGIGAGIWNTLLIFMGSKLGENWNNLENILSPILTPIKYIVIVSILVFIVFQVQKVYKIFRNDKKK
jgi:membrane protein DedA with SNARE-associated domain